MNDYRLEWWDCVRRLVAARKEAPRNTHYSVVVPLLSKVPRDWLRAAGFNYKKTGISATVSWDVLDTTKERMQEIAQLLTIQLHAEPPRPGDPDTIGGVSTPMNALVLESVLKRWTR